MDWTNFQHHGDSPSAAFEALTGLLFERFCRREYGATLRALNFVRGAGGDGGVEAYAVLTSGDVIGLQAKWFRDTFGPKQFDQIDDSFRTAISVRPNLTKYCVAIPRKLGDDRTKKPSGTREEKTERARWDEWTAKARTMTPKVTIELWDEAKLEQLLTEPENEGLHAHWFSRSIFTLDNLKNQFRGQRRGWLRERYVPEVHAAGELERDLALRLGEPAARAEVLGWVRDVQRVLDTARDAVARLDRHPVFMERIANARVMQKDALEALSAGIEAAKILGQGLRLGERCPGAISLQTGHERSVRVLYHTLTEAENKRAFRPLGEIRESIGACFAEIYPAWERLVEYWEFFWLNVTTKHTAYTGRPGVGKTHALARMVEARLLAGLPAVLLRGKTCPVQEDLPTILRRAFDCPSMNLVEILNALEATAARADARRSLRSPKDQLPRGIENEPTCFLLAIDGLEESGAPSRWAELLGELASHVERYPRIRIAISLRTSACDAILGQMSVPDYSETVLPEDGDVQRLLPIYCKHYGMPLPERRVRWAIRDPLSLRLYCDIYRDRPRAPISREDVALPNLFEEKLKRAEDAICDACGISRRESPLRIFLGAIAREYVDHGAPRLEDAINAANNIAGGRISNEQWSRVLEHAISEGLIWTRAETHTNPLEPKPNYVEPANEPLVDYLLAYAAKLDIQKAFPSKRSAEVMRRLSSRPDPIAQVAVLLAGEGVDLSRPDLWPEDLNRAHIDTWVLRAIASMDETRANGYRAWVRERLVISMPSCRRVLAELCIPVARDESHPFGPRFVHEALLPFLPAMRDLFWSGPADLRGEGEPWAGLGVEALEHLKLDKDDSGDGPPLLLGWALTSVDNRWRRRLRGELARWGAGRIDELVRWLELVFETNDPQMAEDAAMVAFGAACLAGNAPRLTELADWVNANLLAAHAPRRRENVVVLHAARGIVERANAMGVSIRDEIRANARRLYLTGETLLPIDAKAAGKAHDREGILPITRDLAWYVVPGAIDPFFMQDNSQDQALDPRAERVIAAHAKAAGLDLLTSHKFAFGVLMAHLNAMGWNEAVAKMAGAIAAQYGQETHGAQSPVCGIDEKYVWTGCHIVQAYLAGRVPIRDYGNAGRLELLEPPVDPVLIADLPSNPVSEGSLIQSPSSSNGWTFWPDDGLTPRLELSATEQLKRAIEWVRLAPEPDFRPWLILSYNNAPEKTDGSEWVTLRCFVKARENDSQGESVLRMSSAAMEKDRIERLRLAGKFGHLSRRRHSVRDLSQFCESIQCSTYIDPSEAVWAPWANSLYSVEFVDIENGAEGASPNPLFAMTTSLTWKAGGGERQIWLPAHWLRRSLGLVSAEHHDAKTEEWQFKDRAGVAQAIYLRTRWDEALSEALVIRRSSLERAVFDVGLALVWPIWLFREPNPSLLSSKDLDDRKFPWIRRHSEFLAFMANQGVDVALVPGGSTIEIHEDERLPRKLPKQAEQFPVPIVTASEVQSEKTEEGKREACNDDKTAVPQDHQPEKEIGAPVIR